VLPRPFIRSGLFLGTLVSIFSVACQDTREKEKNVFAQDTVVATEESPNARILPEPLRQGVRTSGAPSENSVHGQGNPGGARTQPTRLRKREKPSHWPLTESLSEDSLKSGVGAGFELRLRSSWPLSKKSIEHAEQNIALWPSLRIRLLREVPERAARMHLLFSGKAFPFAEGASLLSRADRLGYLLLWPDHRSYRIVPQGALASLFSERRVDRVPFVEPIVKKLEKGERLKRETQRIEIRTSVGVVRMEMALVEELPYAAPLVCSTLLEFIRVRGTPELCPQGHLPIEFVVDWPNEERFSLEVISLKPLKKMQLSQFRSPPALPLFKRGELPPFAGFLFSEKDRYQVFPLSHVQEAPLAVAPATEGDDAPLKDDVPRPASPPDKRPRNQIILQNSTDRGLVVQLNRVPFIWLEPGEKRPIYVSSGEIHYSARDFFGEKIFDEQTVLSPGRVRFGPPERESVSTRK